MDDCPEEPRLFGDYQYYISFGGDQYLDIPLAIDAAYGTRGLIVQVGHFISQVSYEVTGYAALGKDQWFFNYGRFKEVHIKICKFFIEKEDSLNILYFLF